MDIGHPVVLSKERLDAIAARFYDIYNEHGVLPAFCLERVQARYDVELRFITALARIPETSEKVTVTGLLAVPVAAGSTLPVVSWQHGTIFSFDQVPSKLISLAESGQEPDMFRDSIETLFNLHRLAGQGFVVIAADYLGKGPLREGRGEAYAVKDATVACCRDVLDAGLAMLQALGIAPSTLFLNGWSQGGLNTQWLAQDLQRCQVPVRAIAAQSPFNDLANSMRYWCSALRLASGDAPYPELPSWIGACVLILLGSYRAYYQLDDLFRTAIRPDHQALAETFWQTYPQDSAFIDSIPSPPKLLVEGLFDRHTHELNSRFLSLMAANSATFWSYTTPVRLYYGLADEALHPALVTLALASDGAAIQGVPVPAASHRVTFLASLYGEAGQLDGHSSVPDWFRSVL